MPSARVLVTGAAGFMGSHVATHCLALGMEVVAVDDLSGGYRSNVPPEATFVQGDLRSVELVESLWERGPFDYVYHLAAYTAEGLSHFIRRFNYETNLLATVNLSDARLLARRRRRAAHRPRSARAGGVQPDLQRGRRRAAHGAVDRRGGVALVVS